jgi:hypothetical protein
MRTKRVFLSYINSFRGFAMLMIVAVHILYLVADTAPRTHHFLRIMLANSSVLFVFISGYLFQYLIQDYTFQGYLSKKFRNVILPYFIMSVPAILLLMFRPEWRDTSWIMSPQFVQRSALIQILALYGTGAHQAQFWFMPMIVIFYFASPLFRLLDRYPRWYFLLPLLILTALLVGRPILNNNTLQSFVYFLPIYILGMHASHFRNELMNILHRVWPLLLTVVLALSVLSFYLEPVSYLQKIFLTYFLLWFFSIIKSARFDKGMGVIATYSFGIFFIHKYVIIGTTMIFARMHISTLMNSGGVGLLGTYAVVIAICLLLLWGVKLVFGRNSRLICGC